MHDGKWIDLHLRRPGTRRILDALKRIEEEAPELLDDFTPAATALSKGGGHGGHHVPM